MGSLITSLLLLPLYYGKAVCVSHSGGGLKSTLHSHLQSSVDCNEPITHSELAPSRSKANIGRETSKHEKSQENWLEIVSSPII